MTSSQKQKLKKALSKKVIEVYVHQVPDDEEAADPKEILLRGMNELVKFVLRRTGRGTCVEFFSDAGSINMFPKVYAALAASINGTRAHTSVEVLENVGTLVTEWPRHPNVSLAAACVDVPDSATDDVVAEAEARAAVCDLIAYALFAVWVSAPDTTMQQLNRWGAVDSPWRNALAGHMQNGNTVRQTLPRLAANAIMCAMSDPGPSTLPSPVLAERWKAVIAAAPGFTSHTRPTGTVGKMHPLASAVCTFVDTPAEFAVLRLDNAREVVTIASFENGLIETIVAPDTSVAIPSLAPVYRSANVADAPPLNYLVFVRTLPHEK